MKWWDFFRLFSYSFTDDPLTRREKRDFSGAGISQPDAMPDVRAGADGSWGGGRGSVRLRDSNDFVDLSTVTNRIHRYKEYERLRNIAEIETAMTVFADETCLVGETKISTPAYGFKSIEWLTKNLADEKFLVYCWDFEKGDFTLGWAFDPRFTKEEETVRVRLNSGHEFICTPDHKILSKDCGWILAGDLKFGDEIMAFHRIPARQEFTNIKTNQFPRIYSHNKGWIHERQLVDEWTSGIEDKKTQYVNKLARMISEGLNVRQITDMTGHDFRTVRKRIENYGMSNKELKWLGEQGSSRRVLAVHKHHKRKVYDLSVENHENFCTDWGVVHNCQRDEDGRVFQIHVKSDEVKEELEFLFFHRKMLNMDQKKSWDMAKRTFIMGDFFYEVIINPESPKDGILNLIPLPADSMYRIETTKGRLVEYQQSKEGPDYQSLSKVEVTQATEADLQQATAIRFSPDQIIHIKIGDDRKTFYPYGVSIIEAARGPAHQLRLMEDAMVVYRLTRSPERRVFYIDVAQLPPYKAEAFVERMKDQFRKKKVAGRSGEPGASKVEERWHAPAADEDYWIPIRPNANTRVETLPGAQNLGEIDDTIYFRNKLFLALQFPKNYFNSEDTNASRISLSAQDVKFARLIERLQSHLEHAFWEIADRHLRLRGFPEENYEDLQIKMTPPSDWRELTRTEIVTGRINNAGSLKGSQLMSDFDILTKWLKYTDDESIKMLARLKIQKLEDLKMQIIAQNPVLLGAGLPGPSETEVGTEAGGPSPMLGGEEEAPPEQFAQEEINPAPPEEAPKQNAGVLLPEPSEEDIKKYNLDIKDYAAEQDEEEIDYSEL